MTKSKNRKPRGALADVQTADGAMLIKRVSEMRATYQIRLLAFRALEMKSKLVIEVPPHCVIHESLNELREMLPGAIEIVRR